MHGEMREISQVGLKGQEPVIARSLAQGFSVGVLALIE